MLPMIGGLAIGLGIGQRLLSPRKTGGRDGGSPDPGAAGAPRVSAKVLAAGGFAIMAAALIVGAGTSVSSSTGFAAAWCAATGLGLGFAMPTALNAALGALSPERSGSGSALMTAMRQVGGTIGVAVLGTILASVYRSHLHVTGLAAAALGIARSGVAGGIAAARQAASAPLLDAVRTAYVHGMDVMLWVCGGIAVASALLALLYLPSQAGPVDRAQLAAEFPPSAEIVGAPATVGGPGGAELPA